MNSSRKIESELRLHSSCFESIFMEFSPLPDSYMPYTVASSKFRPSDLIG